VRTAVKSTSIEATCADTWFMSVENKHGSSARFVVESFTNSQILRDISKTNTACQSLAKVLPYTELGLSSKEFHKIRVPI
jgi:hypothetical protein